MNQLKVINKNGKLLVDSREVAEMTEQNHKELLRTIRSYVEILGERNFAPTDFFIESSYVSSQNKNLPCFLLTRKGCDMVANKMTGEKGVLFTAAYVTKFEEMEQQLTAPKQSHSIQSFEMQLIGVQYASAILRVDETSKIRMLEEAHKKHGVPTNHLPAYVDEELTQSLTALLKEFGYNIGAAKVNTKLIEAGILEIRERPSSKGQQKEFKSLTENGLRYGKNIISPRSPKETQPHYYPSKFKELMQQIGIVKEVATT